VLNLDKKMIIIIAIVIIIFLGLIYSVLTSGTHYTSKDDNKMEISFNYPDGWTFEDRQAGVLIQGEKNGTGDSDKRTVVTITKISANGTSVKQIKKENVYINTGKLINETNRTIDGVQTKEMIIDEMAGPERGKLGEVSLVIFKKDDYIYTITFVTGGSLEDIEDDINHILNSFHISENSGN
jgi:hypothetical protein